ncbi:unnamed protein product [Microthlaspi erraticum]|uniref:Retrotransposon gag domain-containing protein n=1 Tax=Microthlaspi erraticum TaxID=1685480 RepID=A0A6D2HM12_9BRAS|nr:unnamed protein product [Microthlaspi erraticum]
MITRSRRSNRNEELLILSNAELARAERANRQRRPNPADMGDNGNPNMAAQLQQLQQQIEQMRKAQQDREPQPRPAIGDKDNPHTFIKTGLRLSLQTTTGSNGVPADFLKCKLFPFSLANKASRWLKSLPPGSLTSWDQVRAAFLDHFYTKSKNAALRTKIASFQQYDGEAFCEAWERYKECRRECPHHGYSDEQILSIFYTMESTGTTGTL